MTTRYSIIHNQRGSALVIAMMILILLTVIGLAATYTTTREYASVSQEAHYKESLIIDESAHARLAQEIGNGVEEYSPGGNLETARTILDTDEGTSAAPAPTNIATQTVADQAYEFEIRYRGQSLPGKGTSSAGVFYHYDYGVNVTRANNPGQSGGVTKAGVRVDTVYTRIGM